MCCVPSIAQKVGGAGKFQAVGNRRVRTTGVMTDGVLGEMRLFPLRQDEAFAGDFLSSLAGWGRGRRESNHCIPIPLKKKILNKL